MRRLTYKLYNRTSNTWKDSKLEENDSNSSPKYLLQTLIFSLMKDKNS